MKLKHIGDVPMKLKPSIYRGLGISFIAIFDDTEGFFPVQRWNGGGFMSWFLVWQPNKKT